MSGAFDGKNRATLFCQFKRPRIIKNREKRKLTPEERRKKAREYYWANHAKCLLQQAKHRALYSAGMANYSEQLRKQQIMTLVDYHGFTFSSLTPEERRYYADRFSAERKRYMYFAEYQALARRTQNHALDREQRFKHAMFGMMSELGEVSGIFQKEAQGHKVAPVDLIYELGDMLWFIAEFCDVMGFSLEEVAKANIDKLKARYPEGFDAQRSLNREGE